MNRKTLSILSLAVAALAAGNALAADAATGKTRDQVRAELAEAQRTGDIFAGKNVGDEFTGSGVRKLNELSPNQYAAAAAVQGKTRDQVRAELAEAQRSGAIVEKRGGVLAKRNEVNFLSLI